MAEPVRAVSRLAEGLLLGTFLAFLFALASMAIFVASPFGASLRGTRDQPRRKHAPGYHVCMIRFCAFLFSGLWSGVAGLAVPLRQPVGEPTGDGPDGLRQPFLMVISGAPAPARARRRRRPRRGDQECGERHDRALELRLGAISDRRVHARRTRAGHGGLAGRLSLSATARGGRARSLVVGATAPREGQRRPMSALAAHGLNKSFGGLQVTSSWVSLTVEAGRATGFTSRQTARARPPSST